MFPLVWHARPWQNKEGDFWTALKRKSPPKHYREEQREGETNILSFSESQAMNKLSNQVPWIFKNRIEWERWISLGRGNRLVIDQLGGRTGRGRSNKEGGGRMG